MDTSYLFWVFFLNLVFEFNMSINIRQANDSAYRWNRIMLLWGTCSCSQSNIPHVLSDFQREPGFKSAWPHFPKVVCLSLYPMIFFWLLPRPKSRADYWSELLGSVLSLNNQLSKWHTGVTDLSCPDRELASRCRTTQLPLALTPDTSDTLSFMSLGNHHCPFPLFGHYCFPCFPFSCSPPLLSAHWPLFSFSAPTPSSAGPACQRPHHHNHPLSCMCSAFVCGGKHLRNVLWLRRAWNHRCSLCGLAYSELALCMRNYKHCSWIWMERLDDCNLLLEELHPPMIQSKLCLYTGLHLCYSLLFRTFIKLTSPSPSSTLCNALTAPAWHQRSWLDRLNLPLRPLITKTLHKI